MADGGNFGWSICETIKIAFLENHSDSMLYPIHLESLENCYFYVFAIFSNGHLRLPSRINLEGLHLQIILIDMGILSKLDS